MPNKKGIVTFISMGLMNREVIKSTIQNEIIFLIDQQINHM